MNEIKQPTKYNLNMSLNRFVDLMESAFNEKRNSPYCNQIIENEESHSHDEVQETYAYIIQSYKKMLAEEGIENIHLFRLDAYDRRLYYDYVDTMKIDHDTISTYKNHLIRCENDGVSLKLSKGQKRFVIEKIKKKIKEDKKVEDAIKLLDSLANSKDFTTYFNDKNARLYNESLIKKVLSCIPQEPWTGVAGYTVTTGTIDVSEIRKQNKSRDGKTQKLAERRWDPDNISKELFYRKLMVYEILVGVAGGGSMAAFPIRDCGQISGVLFVTRKEKEKTKEFRRETLNKILELSTVLKHFMLFKRENDFRNSVHEKFLTKPERTSVSNIEAIAHYLPDLFNLNLAVIWEWKQGEKTKLEIPRYIFGYNKRNHFDSNDGLIPLEYKVFSKNDPLYKMFSFKNFKSIENKSFFSEEDLGSLPDRFKEKYKNLTLDGCQNEKTKTDYISVGAHLTSALVHKYGWADRQGRLVIYVQEPLKTLRSNRLFIKHKLDIINDLIFTDEALIQLLNQKNASSHEIKTTFLNPMGTMLKRAKRLVEKQNKQKNNPELLRICNEISPTLNHLNNYIKLLRDTVSRIDGATIKSNYKPESINLLKTIKLNWKGFKAEWAELQDTTLFKLYHMHAKCKIFYGSSSFFIEDDENVIPKDLKDLKVQFFDDQLNGIISNLLGNIYRDNVLPVNLILKDNERATIFINIEKINTDFVMVSITDHGMGMDNKAKDWVKQIIETSKTTNSFIHPNIMKQYNKINDAAKGSGFGISNITKHLYSAHKQLYSNINKELISFRTEEGKGTTFILLFPLDMRCV